MSPWSSREKWRGVVRTLLIGALIGGCAVGCAREPAKRQAGTATAGAATVTQETPQPVGISQAPSVSPAVPASPPATQPQNQGPLTPNPVTPALQAPAKIAELYPAQSGQIRPQSGSRVQPRARGSIMLNFTDAPLSDVVQVILQDLLSESYIIDPNVNGRVTLETDASVGRADLLPILETVLSGQGAALVQERGLYRIVPDATAVQNAAAIHVPGQGRHSAGFIHRVYPLSFLGAKEMATILEPLLPAGRILLQNDARALLLIAGRAAEQRLVADTIRIFDVNQLANATVLLESLQHAEAATLALELDGIFGGLTDGPVAGQLRIVPIERLNALLVLTQQPRYIEDVRNWIARLDRKRAVVGRRLFVYYAQNAKATDLEASLKGIFQPGSQDADSNATILGVEVSPSLRQEVAVATQSDANELPALPSRNLPAASPVDGPIRIMADAPNNAILVLANTEEYALIEDVLIKLDVQPLQVMIEASIVEVTLQDQLRFGVQYFIDSGGLGITREGSAVLSAGTTSLLQPAFPGFSLIFSNALETRAIIDALSRLTEVNVVSSPQLMVLDNQSATLHVGDQVPIVTQRSVSSVVNNAPIVNAIEYRDTGVTLDVTPRVNSGGTVTLDIAQEVSDVVTTSTSNIDSPTIQQRKILSTVAIASRQTVVLGGLIRETTSDGRSGLPLLSDLPIVGPLFGSSSSNIQRTELLVMITPTVLRNRNDVSDITHVIRRKFRSLLEGQELPQRRPRRFDREDIDLNPFD